MLLFSIQFSKILAKISFFTNLSLHCIETLVGSFAKLNRFNYCDLDVKFWAEKNVFCFAY